MAGLPDKRVQGIAVRPDKQDEDDIMALLESLPTHKEDYRRQRQVIPEWALNRGGKTADFVYNPDATGYSFSPGVIVVAEWVNVEHS
jgi:hypothetical protein